MIYAAGYRLAIARVFSSQSLASAAKETHEDVDVARLNIIAGWYWYIGVRMLANCVSCYFSQVKGISRQESSISCMYSVMCMSLFLSIFAL
ncbi:hypothetical protein BDZ91DRAFT_724763 [Kalaharituber pfeilii]|nr:hypothetical protein BDZ91DRAFT_724763 [Kalaharituber pfeilii]